MVADAQDCPQNPDGIHLSAHPGTNVSSGVNGGLQMGLVTETKCIESQGNTLLPGVCPHDRPQAT